LQCIIKAITMKKREPVSHIMTASVLTVDKSQHNLRDVKGLLNKEKIRHVPVMEGDKLCGIISKNDINRLSFGAIFENQDNADEAVLDMLSIDQVMSSNPRVVSSETSIKEVAEILAKEDFHSLPVVDGGKVSGIVTSTDVIKYLLDQY
jgi:CBS domain-containing protein